LRQAYDRQAKNRDRREIQSWKLVERGNFLTLLQQEQKQTLLELGAGTGIDGRFFQEEGLSVICTDFSPEMVRLCRAKGLAACRMDFAHLAFRDDHFDAAYALNCLLHLPKPELPGVLQEIRRVLKPGGLFFMGVYGGTDHEGVWEDDAYEPKRFFSFYTDEHIQEVVSRVFTVHTFKRIEIGDEKSDLHFQFLILRKVG